MRAQDVEHRIRAMVLSEVRMDPGSGEGKMRYGFVIVCGPSQGIVVYEESTCPRCSQTPLRRFGVLGAVDEWTCPICRWQSHPPHPETRSRK